MTETLTSIETVINILAEGQDSSYATYLSVLTWSTLAVANSRYPSSSTGVYIPASLRRDAFGDPDCAGCGYQIPWKLGSHKKPQKWASQMEQRGWTVDQIDEAIEYGRRVPAVNNIHPNHTATRYINPSTGRSVVIDDVTGEILQVGGDNFGYETP